VRNLELIGGGMSPSNFENLSSIECELNLVMDSVAAEQIYLLTERIGRFVKSLTIGRIHIMEVNYVIDGDNHCEIILERIFAACPNLEHFTFRIGPVVILDDRYTLEPSAFKNYQT
jgi:hypothetical protein